MNFFVITYILIQKKESQSSPYENNIFKKSYVIYKVFEICLRFTSKFLLLLVVVYPLLFIVHCLLYIVIGMVGGSLYGHIFFVMLCLMYAKVWCGVEPVGVACWDRNQVLVMYYYQWVSVYFPIDIG